MKNVLVVYYTQSGQLKDIAQNIAKPFIDSGEVELTYYNIVLEKPFPFPWNNDSFFGAFPETFLQIPAAILPPPEQVLNKKYDLVILGYQVWYLTPSIPVNSFLKSEYAKSLLKDTPVVTFVACRNMWAKAHDKVQVLLKENEAQHVGNIALTDRTINHISVITIQRWMYTGDKGKYLGIFPRPGVSDEEIEGSDKFGKIILKHLLQNSWQDLQAELVANDAIEIRSFLIVMDQKANKIFRMWSNKIIRSPEKRPLLIKLFKAYLMAAIWVVSPIVFILHLITYPLTFSKIKKDNIHYKGV